MIILYEKNETAFKTNGIGQLIDCTECIVTEELNGSFSLILKYPLNAALYPELKQSRIILTEPREGDEPQPFRILTVKKLMDNACEVAVLLAKPGDIVLLCPACSSFDQFKNYEIRGEIFKQMVHAYAAKRNEE